MKNSKRKLFLKKSLAFAMALMVGVTFVPLLGGASYAEDGQKAAKASMKEKAAGNQSLAKRVAKYKAAFEKEEVTDMPDIELAEYSGGEIETLINENTDQKKLPSPNADLSEVPDISELEEQLNAGVPAEELLGTPESDDIDLSAALVPGDSPAGSEAQEAPQESGEAVALAESVDEADQVQMMSDDIISINNNKSTGIAVVSGQLPAGDKFTQFWINDQKVLGPTDPGMGSRTLNQILYMYNVPVGIYQITLKTYKGRSETETAITYVYRAPGNALSQYEVYHNYFNYSSPRNDYAFDNTCNVYLDYKKAGSKQWSTSGYMDTYKDYRISNLAAKSVYQARAYYGKIVTFNGKQYKITGVQNNKVSNAVSFKTGPSSLKFKSVKVKLTHVRKHKAKKYGSLGVYHGKVIWYTCKVKATVKLKKKPGASGIYINNKKCKGNKKKYTANLGKASTLNMFFCKYKAKQYTWYKSDEYFKLPKGKRYQLLIYAYTNNTYGGYSKAYLKKPKMR